MKRALVIFLLWMLGFQNHCLAQLINYSRNGHRTRVETERTALTILKDQDTHNRAGGASLSLPSIISGFLGASFSILKEVLQQQQEKYTATYSGSKADKGLIYLADTGNRNSIKLNINQVDFARINGIADTAMDIILVPLIDAGSGLFRFKVKELHLPLAKAKIKRLGKHGKTVDFNIDIKLEAIWKEAADKGTTEIKPQVSGTASQSYQIKSATLGESSILIPSIVPDSNVLLLPSEPYLSGWFQILPGAASQFLTAESDWNTGWFTITITVKEANPFAITSKQRADFFTATSIDISSFLKQFTPGSTSGK